jgi:hypothetical protein
MYWWIGANLNSVIPGPERSEGARNPYSSAVVMDSGLAPSARPGMTRRILCNGSSANAGLVHSAAIACASASGSRWRSFGATSRMNSSIERASFAAVA